MRAQWSRIEYWSYEEANEPPGKLLVNLFFALSFLFGISSGVYQAICERQVAKADPEKFPPGALEVAIHERLAQYREKLSEMEATVGESFERGFARPLSESFDSIEHSIESSFNAGPSNSASAGPLSEPGKLDPLDETGESQRSSAGSARGSAASSAPGTGSRALADLHIGARDSDEASAGGKCSAGLCSLPSHLTALTSDDEGSNRTTGCGGGATVSAGEGARGRTTRCGVGDRVSARL